MKLDLAVVETARLLLSEETATAELESVTEVLKEAHVVKEPVVVAHAKIDATRRPYTSSRGARYFLNCSSLNPFLRSSSWIVFWCNPLDLSFSAVPRRHSLTSQG